MGGPSYRRPPPKSNRVTARYYDSCVDNESEPTMFIVFDIDQHYLEYVIQYESDWMRLKGFNRLRTITSNL